MNKALIAASGILVWALTQCNSVATLCLISMDTSLFVIRLHLLTREKKDDLGKGWTRERGAMVTLVTANVADTIVVLGGIATPEPVLAIAWSRYAIEGSAMSHTNNHSAFTSTVVSICPSRMSLMKVRTVPSSGVARLNYGVTHCVLQRILM